MTSLAQFSVLTEPFLVEGEEETPFSPAVNLPKKVKPKLAYAAVIIGGVFAIVSTQLLLSIGLSNGAYEIESLQQQQKTLDRSNVVLAERLSALSSPQNLSAQAESMGMVVSRTSAYLRLSDGAVVGEPTTASGGTGTITNGQASLTPNALVSVAPSSPTAPTQPAAQGIPLTPWQGELPSPITR